MTTPEPAAGPMSDAHPLTAALNARGDLVEAAAIAAWGEKRRIRALMKRPLGPWPDVRETVREGEREDALIHLHAANARLGPAIEAALREALTIHADILQQGGSLEDARKVGVFAFQLALEYGAAAARWPAHATAIPGGLTQPDTAAPAHSTDERDWGDDDDGWCDLSPDGSHHVCRECWRCILCEGCECEPEDDDD